MATTTEAATLGELLRMWREAAGLQLDDVAYLARQRLRGRLTISRETIRRIEVGIIPEDRIDPVHLFAIIATYGKTIDDLPAAALIDASMLRDLLEAVSRWISPLPPRAA